MAKVEASAERTIDAPAGQVYGHLADMHQHPRFLPPAFSDFQVVEGGVGAGTVTTFAVTAGGRTRAYRMRVTEPEPGRTLVESDANSSLVTTFTVEPRGAKSLVRIVTSWDGAGGIGGFFERTFAPRAMGRIYLDELDRLNAYAVARQSAVLGARVSAPGQGWRRCGTRASRASAGAALGAWACTGAVRRYLALFKSSGSVPSATKLEQFATSRIVGLPDDLQSCLWLCGWLPSKVKRKFPPRTLWLIDIENLAGAAVPSLAQVAGVQEWFSSQLGAGLGDGDQVIVAASPLGLLNVALGWPHARYRVRSGKDGADLELLDVLEHENVAARFTHVVIGSSDRIFDHAASILAARGVKVTVVSRSGERLSPELARVAGDVISFPVPA